MKWAFLLSILILFFLSNSKIVVATHEFPTIDGFWEDEEWPNSIVGEYTFTDLIKVKFAYRFNLTHLFFIAQYEDDTPMHTTTDQDAFALAFDNNGDLSNMGSFDSPDDSIFIGFDGNFSMDTYLQGIGRKIVNDVDVNGENNTFGRYSYDPTSSKYTYEMVKFMQSNDTLGVDIQLSKGDEVFIMLAYWDNLSPFEEISGFTQWIRLRVIDPINDVYKIEEYITPIIFASLFSVFVVIVFARTKRDKRKLHR